MFRCRLADGSGYIELKPITQDLDRHGKADTVSYSHTDWIIVGEIQQIRRV